MISPIVLLTDLAVFSVGRGLDPLYSKISTHYTVGCYMCIDHADVFETPSGVPDHKIKYQIDLIEEGYSANYTFKIAISIV